MNSAILSSVRHDWCTPKQIIEDVERIGPIVLDPCWSTDAVYEPRHTLTKSDDGLSEDWLDYSVRPRMDKRLFGISRNGRDYKPGVIYINPPYGREIGRWCDKIKQTWQEMLDFGWSMQMVALLPSRTDTRWFDGVCKSASQICFLKGRLRFVGAESSAPFPSMLAYWGDMEEFNKIFCEQGNVVRFST